MPTRPLILASASPRRHHLLREAGHDFDVVVSAVEERHDHALSPEDLTIHNALCKACDISARHPEACVLGADTLVYLDGEPLGKPADHREAAAMLRRLAGREHAVCTGIGLAIGGREVARAAVISHVRFGPLDDDAITRYHTLVDPLDKAGAYGIQQHFDMLGASVDGPHDNVMGLPVGEVNRLLREWTVY